ncbi:MAG: EAL domain-containing protein [Leptospiraceae bacterium]|nr:EAL domain-containing protein [Leptospiraceae bacterium]
MKPIDKNQFHPYYQTVFSIEDTSIYGHEILSRDMNSVPPSLPDPFLNQTGHDEFRDEIETSVLEKAFSEYKTNPIGKLFINLSPDRLLRDLEEDSKHTSRRSILSLVEFYQIPTKNIYLEILEVSSLRSLDSLATAVELAKQMGYSIAMDDVGSESSNLERLGALQPDIIRIDLILLKKSLQSKRYKSILEYLKDLSVGIGAELLFEGIETLEEMNLAIDSSARYLQGFLLDIPSRERKLSDNKNRALESNLNQFHLTKRKHILDEIDFEEKTRNILQKLNISLKNIQNILHIDVQSIFFASPQIMRVYATDWNGNQISPYYERTVATSFKQESKSIGKNWSYMSYFYKHIKLSFRYKNTWNTLEPYFDSKLGQAVLVFSKVIENEAILFVDVTLP